MTYTIRKARLGDIPRIAELNRVVQNLHVQIEPELFRADILQDKVESFYQKQLMIETNEIYIADIDQQAVGVAWGEVISASDSLFKQRPKIFFVHHLVVATEHRHKGIGRSLFDQISKDAYSSGCAQIILDSWAKNTATIKFFKAIGFEEQRITLVKTL